MISFIIPVTNVSVFLDLYAKKILEANDENCEFIVICDSVAKEEFELCINSLAQDNVKVLQSNFKNPGDSRNIGLKYACGDWVSFLDSDDCADIGKIIEISLMIGEDIDMCFTNFVWSNINENQQEKHEFSNWKVFNNLKVIRNPGLWRIIFRRSYIGDIRFPTSRMGEDLSFIAKCLVGSKKDFKPVIFYEYFSGYSHQLTSSKEAMQDLEKSINDLYSYLQTKEIIEIPFISVAFLLKMTLTSIYNSVKVSKRVYVGILILSFQVFFQKMFCLVLSRPLRRIE